MITVIEVLIVSLGIGLGVGLERERSHAASGETVPAGLRTFALASVCGTLAALLPYPWLLPAALLGVSLLAAVGYHHSAQTDAGLTSELALLCTMMLGALAITQTALAVGAATVLVLLLFGKDTLHRLARNAMTRQELGELLALAAATLVVWPLLPDRYLGPLGAWNPHTLWLVAVLFLLGSVAGNLASRLFGASIGLPVAGLIGGFISSAATIASMAAATRRDPASENAAIAAALLSCTGTFIQLLLLLSVTSGAALEVLVFPLSAGLFAMLAYSGWWLRRAVGQGAHPAVNEGPRGGLDWRVAGGFLLLTALLMLAAAAAQRWLGPRGLMGVAAVGGLMDAHAAAASAAAQVAAGRLPAKDAVWLVLAAYSANSLSKLVLAAAGTRKFMVGVSSGLLIATALTWVTALAFR